MSATDFTFLIKTVLVAIFGNFLNVFLWQKWWKIITSGEALKRNLSFRIKTAKDQFSKKIEH